MAVSVRMLALELRVIADVGQEVPPAQMYILERLRNLGLEMVNNRAPLAPELLKDAALISMAGYQYDRPTASPGAGFSNAWLNSGAASILARYVSRRATVIGGEDAAVTPLPPTPPGPQDGLELPAGTSVRGGLQWSVPDGRWIAVSQVSTVYYALTRENTFGSLQEALLFGLRRAGKSYPEAYAALPAGETAEAFSVQEGFGNNRFQEIAISSQIANVWPHDATDNPALWVLAPARTEWIKDFSSEYRRLDGRGQREAEDIEQDAFRIRLNFVALNGVEYDAGDAIVLGDPPPVADSGASIGVSYTSPPTSDAVVARGRGS